MGIFGKKQVSPSVDALLSMDDKSINRLLKQHKDTPFKDAKAVRKASAEGRRPIEGEKGMGALLAGLQGGGTGNRNHENIPAKDRVHPSVARRQREELNRQIHDAIARGDRARQQQLRQEAQRQGWLK
jgi:hypothetical protein